MAFQGRTVGRGAVEAPDLPATTCAEDLFSRLDALGDIDPQMADIPVQWSLGFQDRGPWPARPGTWLATVAVFLQPAKDEWVAIKYIKLGLTYSVFMFIWIIGILADNRLSVANVPKVPRQKQLRRAMAQSLAKTVAGRLSGGNTEWAMSIDVYAQNYYCPTKTIGIQDTVSAYLHAEISDQSLGDFARLNNYCPEAASIMVDSQKSITSAGDAVTLLFRGEMTQEEFDRTMRRNGFLNESYVNWAVTLHQYWPQLATVVDWTRRGINDEKRQDMLKTDEGFNESLTDQVREWTKNLGVDDDLLKYHWRQTYQPLSIQDAQALLRRSAAGLLPNDVKFGPDDVFEALRASTIPPAYQTAISELTFSYLGFRQLKLVYDENLIDEDGMMKRLVADGIEPEDAKRLTMLYAKLRPAYRRRKIGAGGASAFTKLYAQGAMGVDEYAAELQAEGFDQSEIQEAIQEAKAERLRNHRAELVKFLKAKFTRGEATVNQVQGVLLAVGLGPEDVADLLRLWQVEFELHPRQESARTLLDWYGKGLMGELELVHALGQLRYADVDIARMIAAWEMDDSRKKLKEAESLVTKAAGKQSAQARAWAADLRQVEKTLGRIDKRTVTVAGKLLRWTESRVTGPLKPVAKKGPPINGNATLAEALSSQAQADAAAFIEGSPGGASGATIIGDGAAEATAVAEGEANPASPGQSSAGPSEQSPATGP